jgi:hypothetical protein
MFFPELKLHHISKNVLAIAVKIQTYDTADVQFSTNLLKQQYGLKL